MVDGSGSMEDLASPMSVALRPLLQRFAVRLQSNISSVESALEWLNRGARQILLVHDVLSPEELSQVGEGRRGGGGNKARVAHFWLLADSREPHLCCLFRRGFGDAVAVG